MAEIDIVAEIMAHTDNEIIDFLGKRVSNLRSNYIKAVKAGNPALLYGITTDLDLLYYVITEMDRRNKERSLQ